MTRLILAALILVIGLSGGLYFLIRGIPYFIGIGFMGALFIAGIVDTILEPKWRNGPFLFLYGFWTVYWYILKGDKKWTDHLSPWKNLNERD